MYPLGALDHTLLKGSGHLDDLSHGKSDIRLSMSASATSCAPHVTTQAALVSLESTLMDHVNLDVLL
jgi:hypothetical protein